jgi:hypothetical protein
VSTLDWQYISPASRTGRNVTRRQERRHANKKKIRYVGEEMSSISWLILTWLTTTHTNMKAGERAMIVVGKRQKGWVVSEQGRHSSCFGTPAKQWLTHSVAHCIWYRNNNITDKEMAILQSLLGGRVFLNTIPQGDERRAIKERLQRGHLCHHGKCSRGQTIKRDYYKQDDVFLIIGRVQGNGRSRRRDY